MMKRALPDGPFTTADAARLDTSRTTLTRWVREGRLRRLFTGVYVRADLPDTTLLRAQAARLVLSTHSVLCDRTAAWIHGIDVFRYAELDAIPELETVVLRGHDPTDRGGCRGGSRDLEPGDWQVIGGVRVTTPVRTALDLACRLPRRDALAALDAFARECGVTIAQLDRLLVRYHRRRGVVQARELAQLVDARSESRRESWTRLELNDEGLPAPTPQHWILVDGVPTYRLDLAYPRARVAVEYDGEDFHTSPEQRAYDRERRAWLEEHGWYVVVVTRGCISGAALAAWITEVREVLRERGVNVRGR
ncbi:type IV toxin-antitoxin system AbiEi family antitoxin domain-containing protein [Nocardioides euryhalodurans]|uniref:DUF559 domain-containing protein n=1 Tax=Nocardioides euryhalodurans TaxID=2518370 RepID=A0A4P7GLN6_9ACTN|nr:type IV toxin-antitoxin system AbiEi family antitoxin domain-containing protein [Nocardioides euryhalodurans]QBR92631.1 DUF559 domain-containing protein [Nocardioides euryhalodurans]